MGAILVTTANKHLDQHDGTATRVYNSGQDQRLENWKGHINTQVAAIPLNIDTCLADPIEEKQ